MRLDSQSFKQGGSCGATSLDNDQRRYDQGRRGTLATLHVLHFTPCSRFEISIPWQKGRKLTADVTCPGRNLYLPGALRGIRKMTPISLNTAGFLGMLMKFPVLFPDIPYHLPKGFKVFAQAFCYFFQADLKTRSAWKRIRCK
jgi:hypothetical protein